MAAPTFVSSSPETGETGVVKNITMTVTFDLALLSTSVTHRTVVLTNTELDQVVASVITLTGSDKTIAVTPERLLIPNSTYQLLIVGEDVNATYNVQSSTSDALATSIRIVFQTGDTLSVPEGQKPANVLAAEGDAILPADIQFTAQAPFRVLNVTPRHHSFNITPTTKQVVFRFNDTVDASTVTGNVSVFQEAFYGEDDLLAVRTDLYAGEGITHYFRCQTGDYTGGDAGYLDPALFGDLTWYPEASGNYLFVRFQEDIDFAKNTCVEITLGGDISGEEGGYLGDDQIWFGCIEPFPYWVTIREIRHEAGPHYTEDVYDDYIGMHAWQLTIDLLSHLNWVNQWRLNPPRTHEEYIRFQSAIDLWDSLQTAKALAAGTSKTLGDLSIRYSASAGAVRPHRIQRLEERLEAARHMVYGYYTHSPRVGVRGALDSWEPSRAFFRDRMLVWRSELAYRADVLTSARHANTAIERMQLPSERFYGITWSTS